MLLAAKPVRTGPLILVWAGIVVVLAAIAYAAGGRTEPSYLVPTAIVSGLCRLLAVPIYVRRRYRDG
jgi:hypothetical protein